MIQKLSILCTAIFLGFLMTNCGPSSREMETKRIADSVSVADSLAMRQGISNELSLSTRTPKDKKFIKTAETKFRVKNVRVASEKIEDLAAKYSGFVTNTDLRNQESEVYDLATGRDSVLIVKKIVVVNNIVLKIPNENLDSLVRELNKWILFLDYRIVRMDEVTFDFLANQKETERLKVYDTRQKKHVDTKPSKLKETTAAEETILNRQTQADNLQIENAKLADQLKYCTLTIFIYQKPLLYKETQVRVETRSYRMNLFDRLIDALADGWAVFETIIVFFVSIWWLILPGLIIILFIISRERWRRKSRKT